MSDEKLDPYIIRGPKPFGPIPEDCLGKLLFDSLLYNDAQHVAMVDTVTGETLNYNKILYDTCHLAEALQNFGCTPNTVITVSSENSLKFFIPVIAGLYLGCITAPLNHMYTIGELKHALCISQPKIAFCSRAVVHKFVTLQKELGFLKKIIIIDGLERYSGAETMDQFLTVQLSRRIDIIPHNFQPFNENSAKSVAFILCSSGTTGLPKGVMLTHRNVVTRNTQSRDPIYDNSTSVTLGIMPFFHAYGLNTGLHSIINKTLVAVLKAFNEDFFLKTIQDYKISSLLVAPPLAVFLAKTPKLDKYNLSCVEQIWCGAAPLSKQVEDTLKKRFKKVQIKQAYGLTETNLGVTVFKKNDERSGSCGQVVTYTTLKIRDPETGMSLGPNQVGEICVKGPSVMKGYYNNEKATKEAFTEDGWLRTGDLAYYDEDKYFYIVDRLKELIKYKGYQVAPAELEALLLEHQKVLDVGVVGIPDDVAGELPLAFVVKKPGCEITAKQLQEYVAVNMLLTSSAMFDIFIIALVIFLIAYNYATRYFNYWKKRGVYCVKPTPFLGNFGDVVLFRKIIQHWMKDLYDSVDEPYFGFFVFNKPYLMIKSLDLAKNILVKDFSNFPDRSSADPKHNEIHGNMMVFQKNPEWKLTRSKMTTVFTSLRLKAMMPILTKIGEDLQHHLNQCHEIIETKDLTTKLITEIIAQIFFGIKAYSLEDNDSEFMKYSTKAFDFTFRNAIAQTSYFFLPEVVELLHLDFVGQDVSKFLENAFWIAMEGRKQPGKNDLIDIMKELEKDEQFRKTAKFDNNKIVAQALNFFLAALETTSSTLAFCLYELAKDQDVQDKLRTELLYNIEKYKVITYESLYELKYMDMCIYETLRKFSTLPFIDRICKADYQIPGTGFVIEKDMPVYIPLYAFNYDEKYFPDPQIFRPERFADKNKVPFHLSFGAGPRACIGERIGMLNIRIGLTYILSKYRVETTPNTPKSITYEKKSFFLRSKTGLELRYVKIN